MKQRYNIKLPEDLHKSAKQEAKRLSKETGKFVSWSSLCEKGLKLILNDNSR